jgi:signal transduction histidine kinase
MLHVSDNGRGITEKQLGDPKSLGLIGMRERVYAWGGELTITGSRNSGTAIAVRIPLGGKEKATSD